MEWIKIKASSIDPTGVSLDSDAMSLEKIPEYPTRIVMEIGEYVWVFTDDGKVGERIVPKEE